MAQELATTLLTTEYKNAAVARVRRPLQKTEIEFAHDVWIDVSAYVVDGQLFGDSQASSPLVGPSALGPTLADSLNVTFRNTDGFFDNQTNDAYGLRIRVSIGFTLPEGDYYLPQFIGYLQAPSYSNTPRTVSFKALDYAGNAVRQKGSTPISTNQRSDEYLTTLATLLNPAVAWDTGHPHPGLNQLPFTWLDDESIWSEMQTVAEAEAGRVYFAKGTGLLRFEPYTDWLTRSQSAVATLTTANFANLTRAIDWQNVYNQIPVKYRTRYQAGLQVVWKGGETIALMPTGPTAQRDIAAHLQLPCSPGSVLQPVNGVDFTIRSAAYAKFASDAAVAIVDTSDTPPAADPTAQRLTVRCGIGTGVANARYIENLQLRGRPIISNPEQQIDVSDAAFDTVYGRRVREAFDNVYVQDSPTADAIGGMLNYRSKYPRNVFAVTDSPGMPWLEVGDLVTVTDRNSISTKGYLSKISWKWKSGYSAEYTIVAADHFAPSDPDAYFIVGVTALGSGVAFW